MGIYIYISQVSQAGFKLYMQLRKILNSQPFYLPIAGLVSVYNHTLFMKF